MGAHRCDGRTDGQTDGRTDRQAGRQTDRQTGRQTDRQTDRHAGRQTRQDKDKTNVDWQMDKRKQQAQELHQSEALASPSSLAPCSWVFVVAESWARGANIQRHAHTTLHNSRGICVFTSRPTQGQPASKTDSNRQTDKQTDYWAHCASIVRHARTTLHDSYGKCMFTNRQTGSQIQTDR